MVTRIVSDLHLTHHFDEQKYRFLYKLFRESDKVILNGDIWDAFHSDWNLFSRSSWRHLFPLLRQKQAVYLFGNHDKKIFTPEPWLFSTDWGDDLVVPWKHKELHIEHGHRIGHSFDIKHPWLANVFREIIPYRLWSFRDISWNRRTDNVMRKAATKAFSPEKLLVVGHSHLPALSFEENYLNSGFVYGGQASWLELTPENIKLMLKKY